MQVEQQNRQGCLVQILPGFLSKRIIARREQVASARCEEEAQRIHLQEQNERQTTFRGLLGRLNRSCDYVTREYHSLRGDFDAGNLGTVVVPTSYPLSGLGYNESIVHSIQLAEASPIGLTGGGNCGPIRANRDLTSGDISQVETLTRAVEVSINMVKTFDHAQRQDFFPFQQYGGYCPQRYSLPIQDREFIVERGTDQEENSSDLGKRYLLVREQDTALVIEETAREYGNRQRWYFLSALRKINLPSGADFDAKNPGQYIRQNLTVEDIEALMKVSFAFAATRKALMWSVDNMSAVPYGHWLSEEGVAADQKRIIEAIQARAVEQEAKRIAAFRQLQQIAEGTVLTREENEQAKELVTAVQRHRKKDKPKEPRDLDERNNLVLVVENADADTSSAIIGSVAQKLIDLGATIMTPEELDKMSPRAPYSPYLPYSNSQDRVFIVPREKRGDEHWYYKSGVRFYGWTARRIPPFDHNDYYLNRLNIP